MRVHSNFGDVELNLDDCSRLRHFFARLRLCKHRYRTITFAEYLKEVYVIQTKHINEDLYRGLFDET